MTANLDSIVIHLLSVTEKVFTPKISKFPKKTAIFSLGVPFSVITLTIFQTLQKQSRWQSR